MFHTLDVERESNQKIVNGEKKMLEKLFAFYKKTYFDVNKFVFREEVQ